MFYCELCRAKNEWPEMIGFLFMASRGKCEVCGRHAACHDVPSSCLPNPQLEERDNMRISSNKPFTATVAIIKPDAVGDGKLGHILREIEDGNRLMVTDMIMARWTSRAAEQFYTEHRHAEFFGDLVKFMTSGPCVFCVLVGEDAVSTWREMMGVTNPMKAGEDTIRGKYAAKDGVIMHNVVHGSDGQESFEREVKLLREMVEMSFGFGARKVIADQEA